MCTIHTRINNNNNKLCVQYTPVINNKNNKLCVQYTTE